MLALAYQNIRVMIYSARAHHSISRILAKKRANPSDSLAFYSRPEISRIYHKASVDVLVFLAGLFAPNRVLLAASNYLYHDKIIAQMILNRHSEGILLTHDLAHAKLKSDIVITHLIIMEVKK